MANTVRPYKRKAIWWSGREWFMGEYDFVQMEIFGCVPKEGTQRDRRRRAFTANPNPVRLTGNPCKSILPCNDPVNITGIGGNPSNPAVNKLNLKVSCRHYRDWRQPFKPCNQKR